MKNYQTYFETATGQTFRAGNSLTLLLNGEEIFPAMLEAIRSAEHSIEMLTFVYWHSKVASAFAEALIERAKAGVEVRLLIDALGGATMSTRMVGQLNKAGVKMAWFRPFKMPYLRRFNHRTHRKILVVDGRIGFTGGVGIADQWDGGANKPGEWRETHCRIDGPACVDLWKGFADNWTEASGETLPVPEVAPAAGKTAILTTISTDGPRPTPMETLFDAAIAGASERLWLTTAYFVPNPRLVKTLGEAVVRGVDVRVLTNGKLSNHQFTLHAGRATYGALIEAGVKVYEYQRTLLHVKVLTVDRHWATIGSTNFDNRSLVLNDELNISVVDPDIVARLDRQFLEDLKVSRHIRSVVWHGRSWRQRLLEYTSRAIGGQL
jgi:cardiolipin synthase